MAIEDEILGAPASAPDAASPAPEFKPVGGRAGGHMAAEAMAKTLPEGQGLQSLTNAFNEVVFALPDAAINSVVIGGELAGILPKDIPESDRRDYLTRFFNEGAYDEKRKLFGILNVGAGEKKGLVGPGEQAFNFLGKALATVPAFVAGAAAAPAVADASLSAAGVAVGEKAPSVIKQTATDVARSFQQNPAGFTAAEIAGNAGAAIGASVGKTIENDILGTDTNIGETIGGMGLAAPRALAQEVRKLPGVEQALSAYKMISPLNWAAKGAKKAYDFASINFDTPEARRMHNGVIGSAIEEAYHHADITGDRDTMNRILQFTKENNMQTPKLSVAEETGDPTMIYEQRRLESLAKGDAARANTQRRNDNIDWAKGFQNQVLGTDDGAPSMVVETLRNDKAGVVRRLDDQEKELSYRTAEGAAKIPPVGDRAAQGSVIRDAVLAEKQIAKEEMEVLADVLKIDLKGPMRGIQGVKQDIQDNFFKDQEVLQQGVPSIIRKIALMDEGKMNYQHWGEYRALIGDELSEAIAKGRSTQVRQLAEFKKYWDAVGDRSFGELSENGKIFREAYSKRYVPFESGIAYKVTRPTEFDRPLQTDYVTRDEKVADAFFAGKKEAQEFMGLTEAQPEAREAMRKVILDKAYEYAQPGKNSPYAGTLDPVKLQKFMNRNREALNELGLDKDLGDAAYIMSEVQIRNAELSARRKAVNQDVLNKMLDKEADGELMTANEIFDKALGNTEVMQRLAQRVKDTKNPELMEQLRNGIASRLTDKRPMDNPDAFLKALDDNRERLSKVFTKEHLENIALAAEAMRHVKMVSQEASIGAGVEQQSLPGFIQKVTGTSPVMISSLARAASEGRNSWHNAAMILGSRYINSKQRAAFDRKLWDAMMDPEKARDLALPLDSQRKLPGSVDRRIKSWMFNLGMGVEEQEQPRDTPVIPGLEELVASPVKGSAAPLMAPPEVTSPAQGQSPPVIPPAPAPMQDNAAGFSSLFPHDELGGAIAARGYADGGFVIPKGFRVSDNVEDRRLEEKDIWMQRLLEDKNNRTGAAILRRDFGQNFEEAITRKRTKKEQKAIEDAIHAGRKERAANYPKTTDEFLRSVGSLVEPAEAPRPKLASELEWGEKPGAMTQKAMGGIINLRKY